MKARQGKGRKSLPAKPQFISRLGRDDPSARLVQTNRKEGCLAGGGGEKNKNRDKPPDKTSEL
jgi:hypothetical protein